MVIDMNGRSARLKRCLALILTLVLVFTSEFGLMTRASAATYVTKKIYTFLAEEYFSGKDEADVVAAGILSSGALTGDSTVRIAFPEPSAIEFAEGEVNARKVNSTYSSLRWEPYSCTINGQVFLFNGKTSVEVGDPRGANLTVEYRLALTNLNSALLQIPSTLLKEAKEQKSVLDRLSSPDEPYMGYMKKMTYGKMSTLHSVLDPNPENIFSEMVVLDPADAQKNTALKNCFREVIQKMQGSCYGSTDGDQMLAIYLLLEQYAASGLLHYYKNYKAYKAEINAFKSYLDELMQAETRDGVYLSKEDKQSGVANMVEFAKKYENYTGIAIPDFAVDFTALQQKMNEVDHRLTSPNSMINVSSSNLNRLTAILEKAKAAGASSEQPALRTVLTTESCQHEFEAGSNICVKCETECVIDAPGDTGSGGTDSGDTGSGDAGSGDSGSDDIGSGDTSDTPGEGGSGGTAGNNPGGEGAGNPGAIPGGYDSAIYASSATNFKSAMASADKEDTIRVTSRIIMTEDIPVNTSIKIVGTDNLDDAGYVLTLTDVKASIIADGPLNVASDVEGYVPVREPDSNTYTLAEITTAKTTGEIAGSKNEKLDDNRYLYLDLDPANGMTLDALYASMSFRELTDYTVKFSIEGNGGSGLVKTADRLTVTAYNADGKQVAQITFVVIVMGDTNCNGKVNSSDAAVTKNISMGKESTLEACMAADVNFSGTLETPKVNSSDVSYIMAKWFSWDLNKYVSNLK